MELPLKLEIPKLSHTHVAVILLPFIPGLILIVGLGVEHPNIIRALDIAGLGYKTKLLLVTLVAYAMGLATTHVVSAMTSLVHGQFIKVRSSQGHKNFYWRRLVEAYLGSDLLPIPHGSREDADRTVDHFVSSGLVSPDAKQTLEKLDDRIALLKKPVEEGQAAIRKMREMDTAISPEISIALEKVSAALAQSESLEQGFVQVIGKTNLDFDWLGLYNAIHWLLGVEQPFSILGEISLSLQTSSLVAIWLMIHQLHFWGISATLFCVTLLAVTTWTNFKIFRLSNLYRMAAAPEIAALLAVLKPETNNH